MLFTEKESSTLEFKKELPKNNQIVKTIIAFANQFGGRLIIGISDDGAIAGLPAEIIDELTESLFKLIFDNCSPHILPSIYSLRFGDKLVLVLEVSQGMNKPYFIKSEGLNNGTYIRLGAMTVKATAEIINELQCQSRGVNFDVFPVYNASLEDLNLTDIQAFLKARRGGARLSKVTTELLRSYHLITDEHARSYPTVAGLLLFGKEPQRMLPQSYTICTLFSGNIGREGIVASRDCTGNLFQQFETAYAWLWENLNKSSTIKGLKRDDSLEIPEEAIREALLNSLLHRNWRIQAPNRILVYPTRVEFFSPGVFPGPLRLGQLELGMTHSRNHAIMKVFREAGYIENLGSGFPTIFSSFRKAHLEKPHVFEGVEFVKCILPRTKLMSSGNDGQDAILQLFACRDSISKQEAMKLIGLTSSSATRILAKMVSQGVLQRHGLGPATRYFLENMGTSK